MIMNRRPVGRKKVIPRKRWFDRTQEALRIIKVRVRGKEKRRKRKNGDKLL